MKHIIFVGMKRASKRNLRLLKRDMPMNESYHISSSFTSRIHRQTAVSLTLT